MSAPLTMLPELANAPSARPSPGQLLDAYVAHLRSTRRRVWKNSVGPARRFLRRWPAPQTFATESLEERLGLARPARPFLTFLLLFGHLRPGYDYLLARTFTSLWREVPRSPLADDVARFVEAAARLGYSPQVRSGMASQVVVRLLVQTAKSLAAVDTADLDELEQAIAEKEGRSAAGRLHHYRGALFASREVLYHLGVLSEPPSYLRLARGTWIERMAGVPPPLQATFAAYLERLSGTHAPGTLTSRATRLAHFGRFLTGCDPDLTSLAGLDRPRHIQPSQ